MRHPYVDYPAGVYNDYYAAQVGGNNLAYFAGGRNQRGHGLGNLFGNVLRKVVLPTLGRVLKREVPKRVLALGQNVMNDVEGGGSWRQSLKNRGLQQLKGMAQNVITKDVLGRPVKRKRATKRRVTINTGPPGTRVRTRGQKRIKRTKRDIFG